MFPLVHFRPFQMRFQAKLQKEQDQKRTELGGGSSPGGGNYYRTTTTSVTTTATNGGGPGSTPVNSVGGGKVRQLFEERRQRGVGIDKSYPLQPISGSGSKRMPENGRASLGLGQKAAHQPFTSSRTSTVSTRPLPGGHLTTTRTVTTSKYDTNNNFDATDHGDHHPTLSRFSTGGGGIGLSGLNGKLAGLSLQSNGATELNNNNNLNTSSGAIKLKPVNLPGGGGSSSATSTTTTRTVINGHSGGGGPGGVIKRTVTTSINNNGGGDINGNNSSFTTTRSSPAPTRTPTKATVVTNRTSPKAAAATVTPVRVRERTGNRKCI